MKYHCSGCDYIYDEKKGDEDLGVDANTLFENLPNDYFCPFCETHKDDFVVLTDEINFLIDINKLSNLDLEHYPKMNIKDDILSFEIGMLEHPNDENHFISKVELYDENDLIDKKIFGVGEEFSGTFDIEYMDEFELRIYCIKDGIFSTGLISR